MLPTCKSYSMETRVGPGPTGQTALFFSLSLNRGAIVRLCDLSFFSPLTSLYHSSPFPSLPPPPPQERVEENWLAEFEKVSNSLSRPCAISSYHRAGKVHRGKTCCNFSVYGACEVCCGQICTWQHTYIQARDQQSLEIRVCYIPKCVSFSLKRFPLHYCVRLTSRL